MAGILDGVFGGGGTGILGDWLWNPQRIADMPTAMAGGAPAVADSHFSIADMFGGGANPNTDVPLPRARPAINPGDEGGGPPAQAVPPAGNVPPPGNPVAGGGDLMSSIGDWINNNRNALALFGAGIAGGGGTGSWNAGMNDALRGLVTGGRIDREQRQQQAVQQYINNATDIDPQRKAAMLANPALAALYLGARAKRPYAGAPAQPAKSMSAPVGYNWADVRDTSKGLQPRANAPEPGGSIVGKPGETIIGYGEWQTLPNGARIRQMK